MTSDEKIKDEKIQDDINREAAKASALSSGKNTKYEFLTGEEILPSNQKQVIEQTKFTYFPLRKAFEKQRKIIEDQGKKQIKQFKEYRKEIVKSNKDVDKDVDKNSKSYKKLEDKTFDDLSYERMDEIRDLDKHINFNNLTCYFKSKDIAPINFIDSKGPLHLSKTIFSGDTSIEKAEKNKNNLDLI